METNEITDMLLQRREMRISFCQAIDMQPV